MYQPGPNFPFHMFPKSLKRGLQVQVHNSPVKNASPTKLAWLRLQMLQRLFQSLSFKRDMVNSLPATPNTCLENHKGRLSGF